MTVYNTRIKRNLRETTNKYYDTLERIGMMRGVIRHYAKRDPEGAELIFEILTYIETGRLPDGVAEALGGVH